MDRKTAFLAAAVAAAAAHGALAQAQELNDLQIAHAAYTAGAIDIRYAHLALALSDTPEVREFAETMVRDHTTVNDEAIALVTKLDVTPEDNDLSKVLNQGALKKRSELRGLDGNAFDCAYAENELAYHKVVNETVEGNFIPTATVPELKMLLADALATFKAHQGHAEQIVETLGCG